MGGWSLYSNLLIMSKEFAVVLGTLATPLAPPLDKVINESVALMNNLLYYGHFLAIKSENTKYYLHVKWNAPSRRIYAKKTCIVWHISLPLPTETWCMLVHLTLFAHAAILSTLHGSNSCGSLLRVQMLQGRPLLTSQQTWDQCAVGPQWSS